MKNGSAPGRDRTSSERFQLSKWFTLNKVTGVIFRRNEGGGGRDTAICALFSLQGVARYTAKWHSSHKPG